MEYHVEVRMDADWSNKIDVSDLLAKLGKAIVADAKRYAPVDTGALKASLDYKVEGKSVIIGSDKDYAGYVELGTRFQKAQPFLRPAVNQHRELR